MRTVCLALVIASWASPAQAEDPACASIRCGHGACMAEAGQPFCFCDEGYAADGLRCVRARRAHEAPRDPRLGGRIVYVAVGQVDRRREQVAAHEPPYELRRYLDPGEMWCSEFISWVYAAAGAPFTGGYQGGWLLTNNIAIRTWFERQSLWISATGPDWRRFRPQPGDYVRMHTRRGHGHSAIVRYVLGDTLYTVEGNVGNRVRLRSYPHYRDDWRFDGIGILTSPAPRRAMLDRSRDPGVLPPRRDHATEPDGVRAALDPRGVRPGRVPPAPLLRSRARDRGDRALRERRPSAQRPVSHHGARRAAGRPEPRA